MSIGGEGSRVLCRAMGIDFKLEPLDCQPFWHGYGEKCSDSQLTIGIWRMPITDVNGTQVLIPFYITPGYGILLLGNEICHKSNIMGSENIIIVPRGVRVLSQKELVFKTFAEPVGTEDAGGMRTYLFVVPSKTRFFKTWFSSSNSFVGSQDPSPLGDLTDKTQADKFAKKLHVYSHLAPDDMKTLCKRAGVLNRVLSTAIDEAFRRCNSCQSTGRPLQSRKVSLSKILASFNDHVQVDFVYITELSGTKPILHMVDVHTGFSATALPGCRDINVAARAMESVWFSTHGAPTKLSGDPEFLNNKFKKAMDRFGIMIEQRAARRHQKIGTVERKNSILRRLVQCITKDVEFLNAMGSTQSVDDNKQAILSRATFLSNVLYGSKKLSSFEMARGYTPSLCGLPKSRLASKMQKAHEEQVARRGLHVIAHGRTPRVLKPDALPKGKEVFFFRRSPPQPRWIKAYVRDAQEHLVLLSTRPDHAGKPVRAAYEDVRLAPENPLLRDLDCQEPVFPCSDSIFNQAEEPGVNEDPEQIDEEVEEATDVLASTLAPSDEVGQAASEPVEIQEIFDLIDLDNSKNHPALLLDQDESEALKDLIPIERGL